MNSVIFRSMGNVDPPPDDLPHEPGPVTPGDPQGGVVADLAG
jgi:hypothetical protein